MFADYRHDKRKQIFIEDTIQMRKRIQNCTQFVGEGE